MGRVRPRLVGLLSGSDSSGGSLPNDLVEEAVWSSFSVEKGGAGVVLEESQIMTPKRLGSSRGTLGEEPLPNKAYMLIRWLQGRSQESDIGGRTLTKCRQKLYSALARP